MKGYILDTNHLDLYLKNRDAFKRHLNSLGSPFVWTTTIACGEVLFGLHKNDKFANERGRAIIKFLSDEFNRPLNIQKGTHKVYGKLKGDVYKKYAPKDHRGKLRPEDILVDKVPNKTLGVDDNDLWMIAMCIERNAVFLTADKMGHVKTVAGDGFHTEDWTGHFRPN